MRAAAAAALAALALALAACGSSNSTAPGADPAGAVPAVAPLYLGVSVRPSGALKTAALQSGRALTHQQEPYTRLVSLLRTPGSPALDFSRDVAPWLGEKAGLFIASADARSSAAATALLQQVLLRGSSAPAFPFASGLQGALVLDTSDVSKARAFLNTQAGRSGAHTSVFRGTTYAVAPSGVAFAIDKRFAVLGTEAAVRGVIETGSGGASLAGSTPYRQLVASAPSGALAHLYSAPAGTATAPASASGLVQLLVGARAANVSVVPSASSIALDADLLATQAGTPGGMLAAGTSGEQAFSELPADSWLALGVGNVGATLGEDVAGLRALARLAGGGKEGASSAINIGALVEGLLDPLGLMGAPTPQARRDYGSWMGSGGIFASGSSLLELKGATVINSRNPALSSAAVGKLAQALRARGASVLPATLPGTDAAVSVRLSGLPLPLFIANGQGADGTTKFVLGLGEQSVDAALHPQGTLAASATQRAASSALGEGIAPNLAVNVPTILSLLEGVGLTEDPTFAAVVPFLRSTTTVYGGVHSLGGGIERVRIVVGLRGGEG